MNKKEFIEDMLAYYHVNPRALNEDGVCCYRTIDGNKCVIGRYILDEQYIPSMENLNVSVLIQKYRNSLPEDIRSLGKDFLAEMQSLHDNDYSWINIDNKNYLTISGKVQLTIILERYAITGVEYEKYCTVVNQVLQTQDC